MLTSVPVPCWVHYLSFVSSSYDQSAYWNNKNLKCCIWCLSTVWSPCLTSCFKLSSVISYLCCWLSLFIFIHPCLQFNFYSVACAWAHDQIILPSNLFLLMHIIFYLDNTWICKLNRKSRDLCFLFEMAHDQILILSNLFLWKHIMLYFDNAWICNLSGKFRHQCVLFDIWMIKHPHTNPHCVHGK